MAMDVQIDDMQEYKFIKPIFEALEKNNALMELMKQVFYDTNIPQYFQYLSSQLKNDPDFIKGCLEKNLISISEVPPQLLNQEFISKELYISNCAVYFNSEELYHHDEEIVFAILTNNEANYWGIRDEFKNNSKFMIKCVAENSKLYNFVNENIQKEFLENHDLVKKVLKSQPHLFDNLPEEKKYDVEILKSVLETLTGYNIARDHLKKTRDPEVALMALKNTDEARKNIHQMYVTILNQNKVKENCYNFLKIYLEHKEFQKDLSVEEPNVNKPKVKI
jgi:hypothetical protein